MNRLVQQFNGPFRRDTTGASGASRFSDAKLDALIEASAVETEPVARQSQIRTALL